jgi:hypothetical protein
MEVNTPLILTHVHDAEHTNSKDCALRNAFPLLPILALHLDDNTSW